MLWKDYEELADDARYTPEYAELYKKRKETIERVFADAKEKHAMRYTHYRGLAQVTNWVRLKFVAMNLKKFAFIKSEEKFLTDIIEFKCFDHLCIIINKIDTVREKYKIKVIEAIYNKVQTHLDDALKNPTKRA